MEVWGEGELTRCVVHVHTASSMSMAGSSCSGESIENDATLTPCSPTVWHTAVAAEPAGADSEVACDFSEQYLALVRQSVTGALDVTCQADGWRVSCILPWGKKPWPLLRRLRQHNNPSSEDCRVRVQSRLDCGPVASVPYVRAVGGARSSHS
jgi:hypothetical protein